MIGWVLFIFLSVRWLAYERKMSKKDYRTGFDDGYNRAFDDHYKTYSHEEIEKAKAEAEKMWLSLGDKESFALEAKAKDRLWKESLVTIQELEKILFSIPMSHTRSCTYDNAIGDEAEFCTCGLRDRRKAIDNLKASKT